MHWSHKLAPAAMAIALAGCGPGAQPENVQRIKVENPDHERLLALNSANQRLTLTIAIRDNGKRCQRVESARYQQDHRGMAMWVGLCNDGRHWAIFIAPNGDTQVRACEEARQLNLPQCQPVPPPATESILNGIAD